MKVFTGDLDGSGMPDLILGIRERADGTLRSGQTTCAIGFVSSGLTGLERIQVASMQQHAAQNSSLWCSAVAGAKSLAKRDGLHFLFTGAPSGGGVVKLWQVHPDGQLGQDFPLIDGNAPGLSGAGAGLATQVTHGFRVLLAVSGDTNTMMTFVVDFTSDSPSISAQGTFSASSPPAASPPMDLGSACPLGGAGCWRFKVYPGAWSGVRLAIRADIDNYTPLVQASGDNSGSSSTGIPNDPDRVLLLSLARVTSDVGTADTLLTGTDEAGFSLVISTFGINPLAVFNETCDAALLATAVQSSVRVGVPQPSLPRVVFSGLGHLGPLLAGDQAASYVQVAHYQPDERKPNDVWPAALVVGRSSQPWELAKAQRIAAGSWSVPQHMCHSSHDARPRASLDAVVDSVPILIARGGTGHASAVARLHELAATVLARALVMDSNALSIAAAPAPDGSTNLLVGTRYGVHPSADFDPGRVLQLRVLEGGVLADELRIFYSDAGMLGQADLGARGVLLGWVGCTVDIDSDVSHELGASLAIFGEDVGSRSSSNNFIAGAPKAGRTDKGSDEEGPGCVVIVTQQWAPDMNGARHFKWFCAEHFASLMPAEIQPPIASEAEYDGLRFGHTVAKLDLPGLGPGLVAFAIGVPGVNLNGNYGGLALWIGTVKDIFSLMDVQLSKFLLPSLEPGLAMFVPSVGLPLGSSLQASLASSAGMAASGSPPAILLATVELAISDTRMDGFAGHTETIAYISIALNGSEVNISSTYLDWSAAGTLGFGHRLLDQLPSDSSISLAGSAPVPPLHNFVPDDPSKDAQRFSQHLGPLNNARGAGIAMRVRKDSTGPSSPAVDKTLLLTVSAASNLIAVDSVLPRNASLLRPNIDAGKARGGQAVFAGDVLQRQPPAAYTVSLPYLSIMPRTEKDLLMGRPVIAAVSTARDRVGNAVRDTALLTAHSLDVGNWGQGRWRWFLTGRASVVAAPQLASRNLTSALNDTVALCADCTLSFGRRVQHIKTVLGKRGSSVTAATFDVLDSVGGVASSGIHFMRTAPLGGAQGASLDGASDWQYANWLRFHPEEPQWHAISLGRQSSDMLATPLSLQNAWSDYLTSSGSSGPGLLASDLVSMDLNQDAVPDLVIGDLGCGTSSGGCVHGLLIDPFGTPLHPCTLVTGDAGQQVGRTLVAVRKGFDGAGAPTLLAFTALLPSASSRVMFAQLSMLACKAKRRNTNYYMFEVAKKPKKVSELIRTFDKNRHTEYNLVSGDHQIVGVVRRTGVG